MSPVSEQLSPGLFVVRPAATAAAAGEGLKQLTGVAGVEPLSGRTPGWVVRMKKPARSAREGWSRLQRRLGTDYLVLPAILDATTGQPRYPTGLLSLRFGDDADEDTLRRIAATYGLEFVGRTKFTRQQALFRPAAGSGVFLPDVSGRIEHDALVEAVWIDAESAFARA